jgi:poly-D-alanine transfer protein DltD
MAIVSFTKEELRNKPSQTNWALVNKLIAEGVEQEAEGDFEVTDEMWEKALREREARLAQLASV